MPATWAVRLIDAFADRYHAFRRELSGGRWPYAVLMTALLYPPSRLLHEAGHLAAGLLLGGAVEGFHIGGSWPLGASVAVASFKIRSLDLYLRVEPNLLWGAYVRWDTREVWWVLRPLLAITGPAVTFLVGRLAWGAYFRGSGRRWAFALYAVNLALFLFGFVIPIPGKDGYHFWRMVMRKE
jgi:hypothetical protein